MSRFRGSIDVPLTRAGYHHALDVGFDIAHVDVIVHDWQKRTTDTARCIKVAHPMALLEIQPVSSQRLGWIEGMEVNEETLTIMRSLVQNENEIPGCGMHSGSRLDPQCFSDWLRQWFWTFDDLNRWAWDREQYTLIVTHNRNIQALLSREYDTVNHQDFDVPGPEPCEIVHCSKYVSVIRHAETDWGT